MSQAEQPGGISMEEKVARLLVESQGIKALRHFFGVIMG